MSLVVERGASRGGRWLRDHRVRLALWVAVVEGLLVVFDVIPWWVALVAALALVTFYVAVGRHSHSNALRQTSWIGASSQLLVALVPLLVVVVGTLALIAVGLLAVVALVFLFADRR